MGSKMFYRRDQAVGVTSNNVKYATLSQQNAA